MGEHFRNKFWVCLGFSYKYDKMRVLGVFSSGRRIVLGGSFVEKEIGKSERNSGELGPARWRGSNGFGFGDVLEGFQHVAWASLEVHQPPF